MDNTATLTLIEGTFTNNEAKEILSNIFLTKINFHKTRNFSSVERFGKEDEISQSRIPALKTELEKLHEFLAEAKADNKKLVITSAINISFANDI